MARRLLTIPLCLVLTLLITLLLPVLILAALLISRLGHYRGAVPTLLFVLGYLWCETIGIVTAGYCWVRFRERERFLQANYRLQGWWANALKVLAERLFRLDFEVDGSEALEGPPAFVLPRHSSIADTVIPMVWYAIPQQVRLRYVLKRELLLDPCLDIVGNRLPNYFVSRGGQDSDEARRGVARLVADLGPDEGALIYPEGTRFSQEKWTALRERYADSPQMLEQLDRWRILLPPRLGGTLALLDANPGRDLLFCAHTGFEGSSHFGNLINGSWMRASIRIRFWRVPYGEVPLQRKDRIEFLFAQWDRMQREVRNLRTAAQASREGAQIPPHAHSMARSSLPESDKHDAR